MSSERASQVESVVIFARRELRDYFPVTAEAPHIITYAGASAGKPGGEKEVEVGGRRVGGWRNRRPEQDGTTESKKSFRGGFYGAGFTCASLLLQFNVLFPIATVGYSFGRFLRSGYYQTETNQVAAGTKMLLAALGMAYIATLLTVSPAALLVTSAVSLCYGALGIGFALGALLPTL